MGNVPSELMTAAKNGEIETVKDLLSTATVDVNHTGMDGGAALHVAAHEGHLDIVTLLLQAGADRDVQNMGGWTPLWYAANNDQQSVVEILVQAGADIEKADNIGNTPLITAAEKGHHGIVKVLLEAGAGKGKVNQKGETALELAMTEEIKLLLDPSYVPSIETKDFQRTSTPSHSSVNAACTATTTAPVPLPSASACAEVTLASQLYDAAGKGKIEIVRSLLSTATSGDINWQNNSNQEQSMTALHKAVSKGSSDIVTLLLTIGADMNLQDIYGQTPLYVAAERGDQAIVTTILGQGGADVNKANNSGCTPLHRAAEKGHQEVVDILIQAGSNVNKADESLRTPLHGVAVYGHPEIAVLLLQAGADKDSQDSYGKTPMLVAATHDSQPVAAVLITSGANVNTADQWGNTPLKEAARYGCSDFVRTLLEAGANKNIKDKYGYTALKWAAAGGHRAVVATLVKAGADVNIFDEDGDTSLIAAVQGDHAFVVQKLLQAGASKDNKNKSGNTAFDLARTDEIKQLLDPTYKPPAPVPISVPIPVPAPVAVKAKVTAITKATVPVSVPAVSSVVLQARKAGVVKLPTLAPAAANDKVVDASFPGPVPTPTTGTSKFISLEKQTKLILAQAAGRPALTAWVQRRDSVEASLNNAIKATPMNKKLVTALTKQSKAVVEEGALLALSEADYLSLESRRGQLDKQLNDLYDELLLVKDTDGMEKIGDLQEALMALDLSSGGEAGNVPYGAVPPTPPSPVPLMDVHQSPASPVTSQYYCGDTHITISGPMFDVAVYSTRTMLRGHFSEIIVNSARRTKLVNEVSCVIKCVATGANKIPLSTALLAMCKEHSMYEHLQETVVGDDTGCVFCYSAHPSYHYLVLEDHGRDLRFLLTQSFRNAQEVVRAVVAAVHSLHANSVMHGDIKPQNILYKFNEGECMVKLCDLDCAHKVGEECVASNLGTNCYLSPEVFHTANTSTTSTIKASLQIDMFAVGLVLWQVLQRSTAPALSDLSHSQLRECYSDHSKLLEHLPMPARADWSYKFLKTLTSIEPHSRTTAAELLTNVILLNSSNAQHGWTKEQEHNAFLKKNVVDTVDFMHKSLSGKLDEANAKLDTVMVVLKQSFHELSGVVEGMGQALSKNTRAIAGLVEATQTTLRDLQSAAEETSSKLASLENVFDTLFNIQSRIESSVAKALLEEKSAKPSAATENSLAKLSEQFQRHFADLRQQIHEQQQTAATSHNAAQNQQKLAKQMNQYLTSSVQDMLHKLTTIQHGQEGIAGQMDKANAKLDEVLTAMEKKFSALEGAVTTMALSLRTEMLQDRAQTEVLSGMVGAAQRTLDELARTSTEQLHTSEDVNALLSTLEEGIQCSLAEAIQQQATISSEHFEGSMKALSAQFQTEFKSLSTDLHKHIAEQRQATSTSATAAQDQQQHTEKLREYLTASVGGMLKNLTNIQQEIKGLKVGQVRLSVQMQNVLATNSELREMANTLITNTHDIPTFAIILPVLATGWRSKLNPMRIVRHQYRLYFLCSHTHQIAPCGPKGEGYKISVSKKWVQDAAPVIAVGLVLLKLALLASGIPLPIPDISPLLQGNHTKYLVAALHLVQNPPDDHGGSEIDMASTIDKLESIEVKHLLQEQRMGEGSMTMLEGTRKAYETIKELLQKDGTNIPLTCGLRQVTYKGRTAWVIDSNEVEKQWMESL